jgi:hypothetical protein
MTCPPAFRSLSKRSTGAISHSGKSGELHRLSPDSTAAPAAPRSTTSPVACWAGGLRPCAVTISAFWPGWNGSGPRRRGHGFRWCSNGAAAGPGVSSFGPCCAIQPFLSDLGDELAFHVCMLGLLRRDRNVRGSHGSWFGVPAVRLPGSGDRQAARRALPGAQLAAARQVVFQRRAAVSGWGQEACASRRFREQVSGRRGAGGAVRPGISRGSGAEDGGVAGAVAGITGVAAGLDQPRIRRACPRLPCSVPRRYRFGGTVACRCAGHVHCDHPR